MPAKADLAWLLFLPLDTIKGKNQSEFQNSGNPNLQYGNACTMRVLCVGYKIHGICHMRVPATVGLSN